MKSFDTARIVLGTVLLLRCAALPARAQEVGGEWTGVLNWSAAGAKMDAVTYNWETRKWSGPYSEYKLELNFAQEDEKITGTYRCSSGATFGVFSITGSVKDDKLVWKTLKRLNGPGSYCMNTSTVAYEKGDGWEYLVGTWLGCGTGKIYLRRKLNEPPPPKPEVYSWTKYNLQVTAPAGSSIDKQTANEFVVTDGEVRFFMHLWKDAGIDKDKLKETVTKNAEEMGLENRGDVDEIELAGFQGALTSGTKEGKRYFLYGLLKPDNETNFLIEVSFPDGDADQQQKALDIVSSLSATE